MSNKLQAMPNSGFNHHLEKLY